MKCSVPCKFVLYSTCVHKCNEIRGWGEEQAIIIRRIHIATIITLHNLHCETLQGCVYRYLIIIIIMCIIKPDNQTLSTIYCKMKCSGIDHNMIILYAHMLRYDTANGHGIWQICWEVIVMDC